MSKIDFLYPLDIAIHPIHTALPRHSLAKFIDYAFVVGHKI